MVAKTTFSDILEAADQLSLEAQENLIEILLNRLRDRRRAEIGRAVQTAQKEFAAENCQPVTPE